MRKKKKKVEIPMTPEEELQFVKDTVAAYENQLKEWEERREIYLQTEKDDTYIWHMRCLLDRRIENRKRVIKDLKQIQEEKEKWVNSLVGY